MTESGQELFAGGETRRALDDPARLELVLQRVADGITVQDRRGNVVYANDAAAQLIGFSSGAEVVATPVQQMMERFELIDEDGRPFPLEELPGRRALFGEATERVVGYRIKDTGETLWSIVSATPILGEDGEVEFAVNVFRDVTERRRQEERLAFLARAGEVLSRSLEYESTLAEVARQAVPTIADWCMVYVQDETGAIRRLAIEHFAGRHVGILEQLEEYEFDPDAETGIPAVLRTGEPQLHARATSALVASDVREGGRLAADLEHLGIRSWMSVPLAARGRTFGAMSFLSTESGRIFGPPDLDLAQELARLAATAVDNARLYQQAQESVGQLEAVLGSAPVGIGFWDTDIRYVRVNETLARLNQHPIEEHIGKTLHDIIPHLADALEPVYRQVVATGQPLMRHESSTDLSAVRVGEERHWLTTYFPVRTHDGAILGVGAVIMEITERKRAEQEAARRARQQADVAEIGQLALSGADVETLTRTAAKRLAVTLGVEFVEVLELDPESDLLRLVGGVGWRHGDVGSTTLPTGRGSQAGYTLAAKGPVVVEDLREETRFTGSPLLFRHDVVSGLTVMIGGGGRPYGALGAHTSERRRFTSDDVNYVQAIANVLAAAIDQWRLRELERTARERLHFLAEAGQLFAASLDKDEILRRISRVVVPRVADACNIFLAEGMTFRRVAHAHADAELERVMDEMPTEYSLGPDTPHLFRRLLEGEALLVSNVDDDFVDRLGELGLDREQFERVGSGSMMFVPFVARGQTLGVITLGRREPGRYTEDELELARELARRAAAAIENARLYAAARAARDEAEARAQAAQALRFVGDGVVLIDSAGTVGLWNPAAEMITGLRADDVVGRPARDAIPGWSSLADRVPIVYASERASTARPETLPLELGGEELWLSISGVGFDEGTVFAFRDVTEERGVEKLKSDFVSTISHELRTPLAAIYGAALTLRRADVRPNDDQANQLLSVIADEAERLARIVSDILWTSRIESGGLQVTIEDCDAVELVESVVQAARLHTPENLAIEVEAADGLPRVAADPDKVRQVLSNLVENAIKYSPDGGTIRVALSGADGHVRFAVSDEGIGIPPREHARIFEKFYRLDPDLTRGVGGTGLGLYICRELVDRMGGRIWVASEHGEGSTFIVQLPAAAEFAAHRLRA